MKIIKPSAKYIDSAKIEAEILYDINSKNDSAQKYILNIKDSFLFTKHDMEYFALVTDLCGYSLYDYIQMNDYHGYPIKYIQKIAKEIFTALDFIHRSNLIHSDLKPENILFSTKSKILHSIPINYDVFAKSEIASNSKSTSHSSSIMHTKSTDANMSKINANSNNNSTKHFTYYLPEYNNDIKIIDFGGALYADMVHSNIVNTRQYRAPEDVLGCCRWNAKSDMWSVGCILFELYCGEILFPTHEDEEHICLIEKEFGPFASWMIDKSDRRIKKLFNEKSTINYSKIKHLKRINYAVKKIDDVVLKAHKEFADLLKFILIIDPNKRPDCKDVLMHNFFNIDYKED